MTSTTQTFTQNNTRLRAHLTYVQNFMEKNGPDEHEYATHLAWCDHLNTKSGQEMIHLHSENAKNTYNTIISIKTSF